MVDRVRHGQWESAATTAFGDAVNGMLAAAFLERTGRVWLGRGGVSPLFIVRDATAALSFYRDQLGFEITFQGPDDDVFFGIVRTLNDGLRGFELEDRDGYVLFFGRPRS